MPRKKLMSWTKSKTRWRKTYLGIEYTVYCSELDLPKEQWTETDSYQAANEWWLAQRAKIDGSKGRRALPPEAEAVLENLRAKKRYSEKEGLGGEATAYAAALEEAEQQVESGDVDLAEIDPTTVARLQFLEQLGVKLPTDLDPATLEVLFGSKDLWADRQRRDRVVTLSKRIGTHLDKWYALVHRRAKPSSIINIRAYYREFQDLRSGNVVVLNANMDVGVINEAKFSEVFMAIDAQEGLDNATKRKKWGYFKNFVIYLNENNLITLPNNFRSKLLVFRVALKSKAAPEVAPIRSFLDSLPDRLRLYALLALNCGMNNVDIGLLQPSQINLDMRTLTRKRVKTQDHNNVPTVTYALWDETMRLLRQEGRMDADYVLTAKGGECLYVVEKVGDNAKLYDRIKSQWRDYFKRGLKKTFTLMQFRFFGADLIKKNRSFRPYREAFLGHAPHTTAEKSYSSDEDVSEACNYLERLIYPKQEQEIE